MKSRTSSTENKGKREGDKGQNIFYLLGECILLSLKWYQHEETLRTWKKPSSLQARYTCWII